MHCAPDRFKLNIYCSRKQNGAAMLIPKIYAEGDTLNRYYVSKSSTSGHGSLIPVQLPYDDIFIARVFESLWSAGFSA